MHVEDTIIRRNCVGDFITLYHTFRFYLLISVNPIIF